jgi:hypothetical protein
MSKKSLTSAVAVLLTFTLVAPATFFIAPQKASASGISCVGGLLGLAGTAVSTVVAVPVSDAVDQQANSIGGGASVGSCIYDAILVPLARAAIRAILQKMTASVINWINGANGTGQPSYTQNLSLNLQRVGDTQALAFFAQFARNSNSPFASAIASSLRNNYLQSTSAAGFWSANRSTLAQYSPNVNSFLAGNWSQGGAAAWLALTTQNENNPFLLYQASQSQLSSLVASVQSVRSQVLSWGQGFMSWCGVDTSSASANPENVDPVLANEGGTSPGDPCINADGTAGDIKTPGSIIHDYTQKAVVNSGFEQLISSNDLDNAFSAIVSALLNKVLGSAQGLFGASGGSESVTRQMQDYSSSSSGATDTAAQTAQTVLSNISTYASAWSTIKAAAEIASTSVQSLGAVCSPEAAAAQTAFTTKILPVFTQAKTALDAVAPTQALALKVQADSSGTGSSGSSFAADLSTLLSMPPSASDIASVQQNATVMGGARAEPTGSLIVTGGTTVDQMNLIGANATALKNSPVCATSTDTGTGNAPSGG